jgi:hypothetical protein
MKYQFNSAFLFFSLLFLALSIFGRILMILLASDSLSLEHAAVVVAAVADDVVEAVLVAAAAIVSSMISPPPHMQRAPGLTIPAHALGAGGTVALLLQTPRCQKIVEEVARAVCLLPPESRLQCLLRVDKLLHLFPGLHCVSVLVAALLSPTAAAD